MVTPPQRLTLYRLSALAAPDDPNWDRAPNHGEVMVRAYSPADARIVAAEAEGDFLAKRAKPGDGTSTLMASAFRDDRLYTVTEADEVAEGQETKRGIVSGDFSVPVLRT